MSSGSSFMTDAELRSVGFATVGAAPRVSRFARFYGAAGISLGDEIRIDDFAILSAGANGIHLEGHNHVAAGCMIFGDVTLRPWSTLSSRVAVYSASDDLTVDAHTYPHASVGRVMIAGPVVIGSRVVVGTGCTILPGVSISDGVSVGAMSLVNRSIELPGLYLGVPARFVRRRRVLDGLGDG